MMRPLKLRLLSSLVICDTCNSVFAQTSDLMIRMRRFWYFCTLLITVPEKLRPLPSKIVACRSLLYSKLFYSMASEMLMEEGKLAKIAGLPELVCAWLAAVVMHSNKASRVLLRRFIRYCFCVRFGIPVLETSCLLFYYFTKAKF